MSEAARDLSQEYWRPAQPPSPDFASPGTEAFCHACGTQYASGARFCHVCGEEREQDLVQAHKPAMLDWMDFSLIRERMGLSTASLVLVVVAAACFLATLLTGVIYSANTLVEWQAVQTWRIEWLLATGVALVGALLFKPRT